jgi:hypothetical protein
MLSAVKSLALTCPVAHAGTGAVPPQSPSLSDLNTSHPALTLCVIPSPPPAQASCHQQPAWKQLARLNSSSYTGAAMCVDYGSGIVIGCLEGAAPPSISCVDRAADGRRFLVPSAWPFPMSTVYRPCSDADTATVVSAPTCQ